jgi:hypothetical protein
VAQGISPEFKPQYHKDKQRNKQKNKKQASPHIFLITNPQGRHFLFIDES